MASMAQFVAAVELVECFEDLEDSRSKVSRSDPLVSVAASATWRYSLALSD